MTEQVLVVEADVVLGAVLAEVLRHSGYEVIFVRTLIGEVVHIDSVSAVILDIDTNAAERTRLAQLVAALLRIVADRSDGCAGTRRHGTTPEISFPSPAEQEFGLGAEAISE